MTMSFTSGVVGTFLCCDNVASPYSFESGTGENPTIPKLGKDFLRVFGTQGTMSLPEGIWIDQGGWTEQLKWEELEVMEEKPFDAQLRHFIKVIKGEEEPSCNVEEGLRAMVVCDAVQRSIKKRKPIDIEL